MLQIDRVTKCFSSFVAISDVSFEIPQGEVVGLLGPNGAGKTTLFRLIAGFLHPDKGQIKPVGATRPSIGFKPEHLLYPGDLRVNEYLRLIANLSTVSRAEIERVVSRALERVKLTGAAEKRIKACSKGMRQRLGLAQVLIGRPALLLVDEPSNGLDPEGQADICNLIRELHADGHTIVLSSHQLAEVKQVCTRVIILNQGRIHYESSLVDALAIRPHVTIQATQDLEPLYAQLRSLHSNLRVDGSQVILVDEAIGLRRQVMQMILEAGFDIFHVEQQRATLEEIYAEVVR